MSITPTISRKQEIPYTVLGGTPKPRIHKYLYPVSIIILNRGKKIFRDQLRDEIEKTGNVEVLSLHGPDVVCDFESESKNHRAVRFLILHKKCSIGEQINIGISEAQAKYVIVLWNDMRIPAQSLSGRLLDKIEAENILCMVPVIKNEKMETVPCIYMPVLNERKIKIVSWNPLKDGMVSLFPFDYCGIYNKEKFMQTGGFDVRLTTPYWQKADFGFRSLLWGEMIRCNTSFLLQYRCPVLPEDSTPDRCYTLFYLKNLKIEYKRDGGVLPLKSFFKVLIKSNSGVFSAFREFMSVKKWVNTHKYRFKCDSESLIEQWEVPE